MILGLGCGPGVGVSIGLTRPDCGEAPAVIVRRKIRLTPSFILGKIYKSARWISKGERQLLVSNAECGTRNAEFEGQHRIVQSRFFRERSLTTTGIPHSAFRIPH